MSTSRVSTRPALASRSSSSSNSLSGNATRSPRTATSWRAASSRTSPISSTSPGCATPASSPAAAPERGAHPGDQLAEPERLGHVVVGADLEPDDGVDLGVAGGHHDDRHLRARRGAPDTRRCRRCGAASRRAGRGPGARRRTARSPRRRRRRPRPGTLPVRARRAGRRGTTARRRPRGSRALRPSELGRFRYGVPASGHASTASPSHWSIPLRRPGLRPRLRCISITLVDSAPASRPPATPPLHLHHNWSIPLRRPGLRPRLRCISIQALSWCSDVIAADSGWSGSTRRKVEPCPSTDSTVTSPPCA